MTVMDHLSEDVSIKKDDDSKLGLSSSISLNSTIKRRQKKQFSIEPLTFAELEKARLEAESEPIALPLNDFKDDNDSGAKQEADFEDAFAALRLETPLKNKVIKTSTPALNTNKGNCAKTLFKTPVSAYVNRKFNLVSSSTQKKVKPMVPIKESNRDTSPKEVKFVCPTDTDDKLKTIKVNNLNYVVLNVLGKGGSSVVYSCYNFQFKVSRAVKCVSLRNPASAEGFLNEVEVLKKLQNCDRIIKLYDCQVVPNVQLLLVLEEGSTDLSRILKELAAKKEHLAPYQLLYYWMEMLYAVQQIHSQGIIHSDLKPANFIKTKYHLKLIDFGISCCVQNDMTSVVKSVSEGSFNYISPEALNSEHSKDPHSPSYGKQRFKLHYKSDVWSLGCILYQLVYKTTPFQHIMGTIPRIAAILNPQQVIHYSAADWVSIRIIDTIKSCLVFDVKARPSVNELIVQYEQIFKNM